MCWWFIIIHIHSHILTCICRILVFICMYYDWEYNRKCTQQRRETPKISAADLIHEQPLFTQYYTHINHHLSQKKNWIGAYGYVGILGLYGLIIYPISIHKYGEIFCTKCTISNQQLISPVIHQYNSYITLLSRWHCWNTNWFWCTTF